MIALLEEDRKNVEQMLADIENCKDEEVDVIDDMQGEWDDHSEAWQEGERGEEAMDEIDGLTDADYIDHIEVPIETIIKAMEDCIEEMKKYTI